MYKGLRRLSMCIEKQRGTDLRDFRDRKKPRNSEGGQGRDPVGCLEGQGKGRGRERDTIRLTKLKM